MKFEFNCLMVSEEKMSENVDGQTDGRPSDWYTIAHP